MTDAVKPTDGEIFETHESLDEFFSPSLRTYTSLELRLVRSLRVALDKNKITKQPVADESLTDEWEIVKDACSHDASERLTKAIGSVSKIISERETLKEAGIELNRANERHFNKATELHAENEILKADLKKANILAHDIGWERDQLRDDNERLKKAASNYASAVSTCQLQNTPEWMEYIVENSNQFLEIFSVKGRLFINRHGNISVEAAIKKAGEQG